MTEDEAEPPLQSPSPEARELDVAGSQAAASDGPPELTSDGRERPHFLRLFPDDPQLQRLVRAFEAGNYELVRKQAPELAESHADPIVRAAARELRRRIDPDPLVKFLLWVALALFVFVVWHTYQGQP